MIARLYRLLRTLVVTWSRRARQRHALRDLDHTQLRDIGLTRHDVLRETDKPFWRE